MAKCNHKNLTFSRLQSGNTLSIQAGCKICDIAGTPITVSDTTPVMLSLIAAFSKAKETFEYNAKALLEIKRKNPEINMWVGEKQ